ncbi:MAG TPA: hypothetical protein V6C58_04505 [Allocoleopsis sp.]
MTFMEALIALRPGEGWTLKGPSNLVKDVVWNNPDIIPPTQEEIDTWIKQNTIKRTLEIFNLERSELMSKYDWYFIRKIRTGQDVPKEVEEYLNELAAMDDKPGFAPKLTMQRRKYIIDPSSVSWPKPPVL